MATAIPAEDARETFLGQPKGVAFLAMTEAWERFSFYGMRGLLVLYMVQELLLPGRIENVAGMGAFRAWAEGFFGPMSTQAFASQTFGLYAGFVYFTPIFGGLIADRWLGAKKTVLIGIALMTLGHFAMVFDTSFLLALVLLVLGSGCLKGNIAAQVGHLYRPDQEAERTRGYTIFSTGINIGATLGPLACGLVAQVYGWHAAFGLAGVMMLVAAAFYFAGWNHFADDRPGGQRKVRPPMQPGDWTTILLIALTLVLSFGQFLSYDQTSNVGLIWVSEQVNLNTPFGKVPEPWFTSEDALASIIIVPFLIALWRWQGRKGHEPYDTSKMATGALVMAGSVAAMAAGAWQAETAGKASIVWPILAYFLSGVAFMFSWPVMLALVSQRAPAALGGVLMASVYLTGFFTGIISGWMGRFYEPWGATQFWLVHVAISLVGAALLWLLGPVLRRRMDAQAARAKEALA
jgi:POT family proton-dependent oligopeptide transporter